MAPHPFVLGSPAKYEASFWGAGGRVKSYPKLDQIWAHLPHSRGRVRSQPSCKHPAKLQTPPEGAPRNRLVEGLSIFQLWGVLPTVIGLLPIQPSLFLPPDPCCFYRSLMKHVFAITLRALLSGSKYGVKKACTLPFY